MHYYIDIVAHTTAFDTPVVGHWLGKSLTLLSSIHWTFLNYGTTRAGCPDLHQLRNFLPNPFCKYASHRERLYQILGHKQGPQMQFVQCLHTTAFDTPVVAPWETMFTHHESVNLYLCIFCMSDWLDFSSLQPILNNEELGLKPSS